MLAFRKPQRWKIQPRFIGDTEHQQDKSCKKILVTNGIVKNCWQSCWGTICAKFQNKGWLQGLKAALEEDVRQVSDIVQRVVIHYLSHSHTLICNANGRYINGQSLIQLSHCVNSPFERLDSSAKLLAEAFCHGIQVATADSSSWSTRPSMITGFSFSSSGQ